MFATTMGGGQCLAAPDVCKTPSPGGPVPVPYPNISMPNTADPGSCCQKMTIMGMPALNMGSKIPMSQGDQAGAAGGVVSGGIMGPTKFLTGSGVVKFEGKPAVFLTSQTGQNGQIPNCQGTVVAPGQTLVDIMG